MQVEQNLLKINLLLIKIQKMHYLNNMLIKLRN